MSILLTWTPRVAADEQRVYRSETPMDPESLPAPLATVAASDRVYTDASVVGGTTYYYRVAAVLTASPERIAVSPEISVLAVVDGGPGSGSGSGGSPGDPGLPYSLPIASIVGGGDPADWIVVIGNDPIEPWATDSTRWVMVTGSGPDRAKYYQSFDVGAERHSVIDAGQVRLELTHNIVTFASDTDSGFAFVEFYDDASPPVFLGKAFNSPPYTPNSAVDASRDRIIVPPGTRTIWAGWQAAADSGPELSVYVKDLAVTLTLDDTGITDAVVVFAEKGASASGLTWTVNTGNVRTYTTTSDFEWQDADSYDGGSNAATAAEKALSIPSGWAAKIAAGGVRCRVMAHLFTANASDDVGMGIEFDNGVPTTTRQWTGRVDLTQTEAAGAGNETQLAWIDCPVPADTEAINLHFEWWRVGGTVSDGSLNNISVLFYEQPYEVLFDSDLTASASAYNNYTGRTAIGAAAFESGVSAGSKVRLTLRGHPTGHARLVKAFVGIRSGTADFAATPVPVTFFGGETSYDIPPGIELVSDELDLPFDPATDELVFSFYCNGSTARDDFASASGITGCAAYYRLGDSAASLSAGSLTGAGRSVVLIQRVEILP